MSRTKKHKLKNMGNLCASAPKNLDNGVGNKPEGIVKGSKVSLIPTSVLNRLRACFDEIFLQFVVTL